MTSQHQRPAEGPLPSQSRLVPGQEHLHLKQGFRVQGLGSCTWAAHGRLFLNLGGVAVAISLIIPGVNSPGESCKESCPRIPPILQLKKEAVPRPSSVLLCASSFLYELSSQKLGQGPKGATGCFDNRSLQRHMPASWNGFFFFFNELVHLTCVKFITGKSWGSRSKTCSAVAKVCGSVVGGCFRTFLLICLLLSRMRRNNKASDQGQVTSEQRQIQGGSANSCGSNGVHP